jgi:8-oxo-dGTP diphosphatase
VFHISEVDVATLPSAVIIAITINDAINPYSTAVAPFSHLAMLRIVSNINLVPFQNGLRLPPIFHKDIKKSFQVMKKMEENPTILIVVAAALTNESGHILLQKRPEGRPMAGYWEFPGGKVETDELPKQALIRELHEEIGVTVSANDLIPVTFATERLETGSGIRELILLLYICRAWGNAPQSMEGQEMRWTALHEMRDLPMPPADAPFIGFLEQFLK